MRRASKKLAAIDLYDKGITNVEAIAERLGSSPSYVANTLAAAGRTVGYHDLYTSTGLDRNRYASLFNGVLRFKDMDTARQSVARLNLLYEDLRQLRDRRGMFHAEFLALMGIHRAHGCGKHAEAKVFAEWLREKLAGGDMVPPRDNVIELFPTEEPPFELYPEALAA